MVLLVVVALWPAAAAADPADVAADISAGVMSPFCDGVTLHDCPSVAAERLRTRIEGWARRGWDRERIVARLEALYGDVIRAAPPRSGAGLVAWLLPGAGLALGALGVWALTRRWAEKAPTAGGAAVTEPDERPMSADERLRLDIELAELRRS